jgi:tRNA threonylcarbamoyladenosine biosynthesis protein TsaE
MTELEFISNSEEDTVRLGQALAAVLPPNSVIALNGTLGAGKTRLVQAIAEALEIDRHEVVSPTFVLMQEYHGQKSIYHVDAYRIASDEEFLQLGMEEYFVAGGLVFIEWAERVANTLPASHLTIDIEVQREERRLFRVSSENAVNRTLIEAIGTRLQEA